jgi:hypothetical protein
VRDPADDPRAVNIAFAIIVVVYLLVAVAALIGLGADQLPQPPHRSPMWCARPGGPGRSRWSVPVARWRPVRCCCH